MDWRKALPPRPKGDDELLILGRIPLSDVRVEVYSTGPVGNPYHATRVTHLPTGIVVEDDEGPSQIEQRTRALVKLWELLA